MPPRNDDLLDRLRIATPCEREWEGMSGDERARHCTLCERSVYNVAEMTRDEIARAVEDSEGRLCVRLTRRSDGTLVTRDAAPRRAAPRSRAGRAAAMVLSAVALASGCASGGRKAGATELYLSLHLEREPAADAAAIEGATFHGVALLEGLPVPGITVTLRNEASGAARSAATDSNGAFRLTGLSGGLYNVNMELDARDTASVAHVALKAGEVTRARATLRLEGGDLITVGAAGPDPLSLIEMSTTFPQSIIDKLPI